MQDIKLIKDEQNKIFDISIDNGDIAHINSFDTSLNASIFLDARASARIFKPEMRNGWLGNIVSPVRNRQMGSLLWLLSQSRLTQTAVNDAVDYVRKSLLWMIEDKVCKNISVSGEGVPMYGIRIRVDIIALSGVLETQYYNLWENTGTDI